MTPPVPPGPVLPAPPAPPPPVSAAPATAPDGDFATLLATALATVRAHAPGWTDHNPGNPGVTLLESVVWSVADLHYRTGNRPLSGWSAEAGLFRSRAERHWSGVPLPESPARLRQLGDLLAALRPADRKAVREAPDPQTADTRLETVRLPGGAKVTNAAVRAAAIRLLRAPLLLRAAMDGDEAAGPLFPEERKRVAERRRRQAVAERLRDAEERIRALVAGADDAVALEAVRTALAEEFGLGAPQELDALGCHPAPPGAHPEDWEDAAGRTRHWPAHPLQARTVEPVTTDDYARLAVGLTYDPHDDGQPGPEVSVGRAWAVPGVLPGIGFDGRPTGGGSGRPGAVTILVEPEPSALQADEEAGHRFLRAVLAGVLTYAPAGQQQPSRVRDPGEAGFPSAEETGAQRRLMGDEVGAALLETCPVRLRGVLYVPVTASAGRVLRDALHRVGALLDAGRPESAGSVAGDHPDPARPPTVEGPWPRSGKPPAAPGRGWQPGEQVRIAELAQVIAADPEVLGVTDLAAAISTRASEGKPTWHTDALPVPEHGVPVLGPAGEHCLVVRPELPQEDTRGC
ncbi:hypothetical protein [Streptomyces sp. NPDC058326]|uniref:hypothetical protein n=1 Tax=Streptomyces sp. NPDC058326 TaxID=3346447 RepID=UPI0036EBD4E0